MQEINESYIEQEMKETERFPISVRQSREKSVNSKQDLIGSSNNLNYSKSMLMNEV